jgi:aspartate/glutamate/glutamine transport system permease protein
MGDFLMDFSIINASSILFLLGGLIISLSLSLISILLSFLFGSILGIVCYQKIAYVSRTVNLFIETIRNLPLLLIIFFTYFALPQIGIRMPPFVAAVASLTLFTSCLVAEIVRGGIAGIEKGQWEAALSTGMTEFQCMIHIILPQAIRRMIPPLISQFISLNKDTSLAIIISLEELFRRGQILYSGNVNHVFPVLLIVSFFYFIVNYIFSILGRRLKQIG